MKLIKTFKTLPMAVATAAILAAVPLPEGSPFVATAYAQEKKAETRKVPALSLKTHKQVQKAQEALDAEDVPTAEKILNDELGETKLNDYERAVIWQMKAMIAYDKEDTQATINAYEKILTFRNSIPEALEDSIVYGLAQLYYSEEKYDLSLKYVKQWEAAVDPSIISVNNRVFIAQLYYTLQNYKTAIEYIDKAITDAETIDTVDVQESWYNLELSAYWELNNFNKVRDVLVILISEWPKPIYWMQLAGVYQELGDENASYSLTEAAYKMGFLNDKPQQLVTAAQIQMARDAPIKCAWVLEKALAEKRIPEDAKNMRLLGQCYMMANEYRKAVTPLKEAAADEKDGSLWFQVGQVYMQLDDMKGAVDSFGKAIDALANEKSRQAKEQRFSSMMMKGQALTELKLFSDAKKMFDTANKAADDKNDKKSVRQWRDYLKGEEAREKMLTGE